MNERSREIVVKSRGRMKACSHRAHFDIYREVRHLSPVNAKILIPEHFCDEIGRRSAGLAVEIIPYDENGVTSRNSEGAVAFFRWWISRENGDRIVRDHPLRWIHTGSAGVDQILTPDFRRAGIILTNAAGVHSTSIAEWVVAGMLSTTKQLPAMRDQQREHRWEKRECDELTGKKVVIAGAGHIGSAIAARLTPFAVRLIAVTRSGSPLPLFGECFDSSRLIQAVEGADWLIVAAPLTESTRGLINVKVLDAMPSSARVVNISRGELIDEPALIEALHEKRLAGAILDVFLDEPLPQDHPFWDMDNVTVLPHTTGLSPLVTERELELFLDNLKRFLEDRPLRNVVDLQAGY